MKIGGLSDFNYCWHAGGGRTGEEVPVQKSAGVRGAAPVRSRREAQAGDCLETNLKYFMNKFCHEMRHDLWR